MDSSSSSEDENHFEHWNNWQSSKSGFYSTPVSSSKRKHIQNRVPSVNESSVAVLKENHKFGHWCPPIHFWKARGNLNILESSRKDVREKQKEKVNDSAKIENCLTTQNVQVEPQTDCWRKILNLDWGKRINLHDATNLVDGDVAWGLINPGVFAQIKLWVNEYGFVCGFAEGTVSKIGSPEKSCVSITNPLLLRKMLNVPHSQWNLLTEIIQKTKVNLKFETFKNFDINKQSHLEKLWFFLCKRRHFLPDQCMLVKLSGAVKCLREFEIIPKLVVLDVRNVHE